MRFCAVVVACVGLASPVVAAPITYTVSGSFSGSLGGASFINQSTTIVGSGDTDGVLSTFGGASLTNPLSSLVITVAGVGSAAVTGFDDIDYTDTGFGFGVNGTNVNTVQNFFFTEYPPSKTYDLRSSLGPVPVTFVFNSATADTTGGLVVLGVTSTPIFTAAVPEPASLALLSSGIVGAFLRRRRR